MDEREGVVMQIANPLVELSEFRFSGKSKHLHYGQRIDLGVGSSVTGVGWLSPIEANFRETSDGRKTRGRHAVKDYYVARQNLVSEKVWHGTKDAWNLKSSSGKDTDNPNRAVVSFSENPAEISFYDSPGFVVPNLFGVGEDVTRLCTIQNFSLWISVDPQFTKGSFPASSHVAWYHLLCLEKSESKWQVVHSKSSVGRGHGAMDQPMWR